MIAALAAWRRWTSAARPWRPRARLIATAAAVFTLIAGSALAARHLDHYVARANAGGRSMLAEMWVQPICSGSPDRNGKMQVAQLK